MMLSPVGMSWAATGDARSSAASAARIEFEKVICRWAWEEADCIVLRIVIRRVSDDSYSNGDYMSIRFAATAILAGVVIGCTKGSDTAPAGNVGSISGTRIASAPPNDKKGEWLLPGHDYSNSRYSELDEITPANAANL